MLTDHTVTVRTVKLPADIMPDSGRYPHYRLVPLTGTDNRYCLFFHISTEHYLILEASAPRRRMQERLGRMLEHAPYEIFETIG